MISAHDPRLHSKLRAAASRKTGGLTTEVYVHGIYDRKKKRGTWIATQISRREIRYRELSAKIVRASEAEMETTMRSIRLRLRNCECDLRLMMPRLMVEMGQPGIDRSIVNVIRDVFKVEEAKMPWMKTRWRENIAVDVKDRNREDAGWGIRSIAIIGALDTS